MLAHLRPLALSRVRDPEDEPGGNDGGSRRRPVQASLSPALDALSPSRSAVSVLIPGNLHGNPLSVPVAAPKVGRPSRSPLRLVSPPDGNVCCVLLDARGTDERCGEKLVGYAMSYPCRRGPSMTFLSDQSPPPSTGSRSKTRGGAPMTPSAFVACSALRPITNSFSSRQL